jgi:hypothetical protein
MASVTVTFTVDDVALRRYVEDPGFPVQVYLGSLARETKDEAVDDAPVGKSDRPGPRLRDQILVEPGGNGEPWLVRSMAPYSIFVHQGTRAHSIDPKPSNPWQRLFWEADNGDLAVARHVDHPGYAGNPWMLRSLVRTMLRHR